MLTHRHPVMWLPVLRFRLTGTVPARLPNGYRDYEPVAVRQVQQICELTRLGLSVQETRPFVECLTVGHDAGDECPASLAAYQRAIEHPIPVPQIVEPRGRQIVTDLLQIEHIHLADVRRAGAWIP